MNIRLLIGTIACFVGGAALLWRLYAHPLPRKDQLWIVKATVTEVAEGTRRSRYSKSTFPVLRLSGRNEAFRYLDWFPNPGMIRSQIKAGDQVTLLADTNHLWIWELQKEGRTIVTYEQVLAAVQRNNRFDPYIGVALLGFGIFGCLRLIKSIGR